MNQSAELVSALRRAGFDEKESRLYIAGLELGKASVLELSRRTRIARTTVYPILLELCRQGIFNMGKGRRGSRYSPIPPAELAGMIAQRQKHFLDAVSKLEELRGTVREGAGVTVFEGAEGFRQLWQKIFNSGIKEYRILTGGTPLLEFVREPYLVRQIIARRVSRGIKSFQLIPDSKEAKKIIAKDPQEMRESRLLPRGTEVPATIIIFGKQAAFITTRRENTMILLASGEAAISLRSMFDLLWKAASAIL